jgi:hypothetical protein
LPMSLGLSAGGEQYEPLGRAVIGGLTVATVSTLFLVPVMYSLMRRKPPHSKVSADEVEHEHDEHHAGEVQHERA